ncbi:head-tail connector protein [Sphingomonas sp.]|uniref:head-tail connector protein n=1 Tax=Sphingomonas sp. TaxID=28214 RepID=UPI002DD650FF|nr:head-tail connector protein [Sphingomonas sp.]
MTREEAKAYLRLETVHEDALIDQLVASARSLCEAFLGRTLIRREVVETLAASGAWERLGAGPVAAVTGVAAVGPDGSASALPVDAYAVDIDPAGDGWVRARGGGRISVTYVAGLAEDEGDVPAAIAQGVVRLVAHLHAHRDDAAEPPAAIAALWRPFRRIRLGLETRA